MIADTFKELLAEAGQTLESFEVAVESLIAKLHAIPEEHRPDLSAELATVGAYHTALKSAIFLKDKDGADGLNLSNIASDDDEEKAKAAAEAEAAAAKAQAEKEAAEAAEAAQKAADEEAAAKAAEAEAAAAEAQKAELEAAKAAKPEPEESTTETEPT